MILNLFDSSFEIIFLYYNCSLIIIQNSFFFNGKTEKIFLEISQVFETLSNGFGFFLG
jgi:hypothetical protein